MHRKKTAIVMVRDSGHQKSWGGAFAAGLRKHGWDVTVKKEYGAADLFVTWGIRGGKRKSAFRQQRSHGGEICIMERGYMGDRFAWTSVSFGGLLNGRAMFQGVQECDARFKKHFGHLLKPWRVQDGYAIIIGQKAGDASIRHLNIRDWYRRTCNAMRSVGYADVRFRKHPKGGKPDSLPRFVRDIGGKLIPSLVGARVCVTCNSNTAVEAVLDGCPTIATDEGSMAWEMCGHNARDLITPDRDRWAARLAWHQWTLDEIAAGVCWEHVRGDL